VNIPSADYMFYDINIIIIKEILFMWQEKKYDKRIMRSLLLSLICMIQRNTNIYTLFNQYNQLISALTELNTLNNINEKYDYVVNKFNPTIEILDTGKSYERQNIRIATSFNFYLDTILCKHIQHIIIVKYLTEIKKGADVSKFRYKKYCDYLLEIHKNIETNASNYGVSAYIAVTPYSEIIRDLEKIYNENFDVFEKKMISIVSDIAIILEGIIDSNIKNINLSFENITELF